MTLVMAVTIFTACGSEKKGMLLKDGELSVGVEIGYPPMEMEASDGKTYEGYDIELMKEIGKRTGLKVNFVNTAFDGIFNGIDKNYDVVCSCITITKERKKTMSFSDPYIDNFQAVVVNKDSKAKIASFKDLEGLTVALQEGTTSMEMMDDLIGTKTLKKTKYIKSEKVTNCFEQLKNGEVDAVLVDSTVADGQVAKNKNFKIAWKDDSEPEQFGIAMGKDNDTLRKAINLALKDMKAKGEIDDSYDYWFKQAK